MKILAKQIITACEHFEIDKVVISPGSRNAPLTVGFSKNQNIEALSIVDERCAAFFALGIAQQTQKPVALLCTSGSALLNYYPAIAEAFYSNIPLVVISADRPKHLIDIGDGQTIRQENVFQNHISYSANLVEGENEFIQNSKLIFEAIETAIDKKSPVHINVPFDEPLYKFQSNDFDKQNSVDSFEIIEKILDLAKKNKEIISKNIQKTEVNYQKLAETWNKSQRKLILIGVNFPSQDLQIFLNELVEKDKSVLVMTETTSNLHNNKFINSIDKLITNFSEDDFKDFQPDLLVSLGGFVVSKRIKQALRKYQPKIHWHIDEFTKLDTYFCLNQFIQQKPVNFFSKFSNLLDIATKGLYQEQFLQKEEQRNKKHSEFISSAKYSDLKVVEQVLLSIPNACQLQISNSSMIRYVQLFDLNPTLTVFCNRGTSGIDGSTSTAIGASSVLNNQTVFLTGDISFLYDSNALWNAYVPNNFRIILVNNDGGGIFRLIPGPSSTEVLPYFETKHGLTAEHLSKMFNFEYFSAKNLSEVNNNLKDFYSESDRPKILEIFTPSDLNDKILKQYFNHIR